MSHPSLAGRATLAVLLLVGFYVLAFALIATLLYLPYAEFRYLDRIDARLTLFALVGAGAIFWAILPRIDRFEPPGPPLERAQHPQLFAILDDVARSAEQEMPRDVYLVADMNAWVAQRGGIMGFGSRRVMGLGLPLMQALAISQLRSVLAHEFGHYHGGDTALGPWIYKTRAAIGRTLESLANHSALLMKPFEWYGNAFLRITHAISRRQEFAADALAARVTGTATTITALKTIHSAGMAFQPYWHAEILPAIQKGYRPPIAEGFLEFSAAPHIATSIARAMTEEMAEGKSDPYDTHPPLRERVAALESAPPVQRETAEDHAMAITLLRDVPALETAMLDGMLRDDYRGKLKPLSWDDAGSELWIPVWREQARALSNVLSGLTPNMLPKLAADPGGLAVTLGFVRNRGASSDDTTREAGHVIGAAMAIALHSRGFAVSARPGHAVRLFRNDVEIEPFDALRGLIDRTLTAEAWREQCDRAAIASVDLGAVTSDRPA